MTFRAEIITMIFHLNERTILLLTKHGKILVYFACPCCFGRSSDYDFEFCLTNTVRTYNNNVKYAVLTLLIYIIGHETLTSR